MNKSSIDTTLNFRYAANCPTITVASGPSPKIFSLAMAVSKYLLKERGVHGPAFLVRYASGNVCGIHKRSTSSYSPDSTEIRRVTDQLREVMTKHYVCRYRTGISPSLADPIVQHGCYTRTELFALVCIYREKKIYLDLYFNEELLRILPHELTKHMRNLVINEIATAALERQQLDKGYVVPSATPLETAVLQIHGTKMSPDMSLVVDKGGAMYIASLRDAVLKTLQARGHGLPRGAVSALRRKGVSVIIRPSCIKPVAPEYVENILTKMRENLNNFFELRLQQGTAPAPSDPILKHGCYTIHELRKFVVMMNQENTFVLYMVNKTASKYKAYRPDIPILKRVTSPPSVRDLVLAEIDKVWTTPRPLLADAVEPTETFTPEQQQEETPTLQVNQELVIDPRVLTNQQRVNRFRMHEDAINMALQFAESQVAYFNSCVTETLGDLDLAGVLLQALNGRAKELTVSELITELTRVRKKQLADLEIAKNTLKAARSAKTKHESSLLVAAVAG